MLCAPPSSCCVASSSALSRTNFSVSDLPNFLSAGRPDLPSNQCKEDSTDLGKYAAGRSRIRSMTNSITSCCEVGHARPRRHWSHLTKDSQVLTRSLRVEALVFPRSPLRTSSTPASSQEGAPPSSRRAKALLDHIEYSLSSFWAKDKSPPAVFHWRRLLKKGKASPTPST